MKARAIWRWPGPQVILTPSVTASASAQGMLSPNGRCRPFDAAADGFVRSEGCGVVLLKRLADAERDGDRILAVIRGTAANQDGRSETHHDSFAGLAGRGLPGGTGRGGRGRRTIGMRRGARHRHAGRRPAGVRRPGAGLRHRR